MKIFFSQDVKAIKYLITFEIIKKMNNDIHKLSDLSQLEKEKLLLIKDSVLHLYVDGVTDVDIGDVKHFKNVETVEFEDGVRIIGDYAFRDFEHLLSVKFPATVHTLEEHAFDGCENLETMELPRRLTKLGQFVFRNCAKLKDVVIPSGVLSVSRGCFYGCSGLETVICEDEESTQYGTYRFGRRCFEKCVSLRSVKFPRSLQLLEGKCFFECRSLLYVNLPATVTLIESFSFKNCVSLQFFCAPGLLNDTASWGRPSGHINGMKEAFFGCIKLETLILGCNSYEFIFRPDMLEGCAGLRNLIFLPGVPGFENKKNIVDFSLPDECRLLAPEPVIKLLGGKFANKTRKNLEKSGLWVDSKTIRRLFFLPEIKPVGILETIKGMQSRKIKDTVLSFELANQRLGILPRELTNSITSFLGLGYLDRVGEAPAYVTNEESGIMYYFVDHTRAESSANEMTEADANE